MLSIYCRNYSKLIPTDIIIYIIIPYFDTPDLLSFKNSCQFYYYLITHTMIYGSSIRFIMFKYAWYRMIYFKLTKEDIEQFNLNLDFRDRSKSSYFIMIYNDLINYAEKELNRLKKKTRYSNNKFCLRAAKKKINKYKVLY